MVTRAVLHYTRQHPIVTKRIDALLCSINDRLVGEPGEDIEPLDMSAYLNEFVQFAGDDVPTNEDGEDDLPEMVS